MARLINFCGSVGANTGVIDCDTKRGNPKVLLIGGASFDSSDFATSAAFKTALLAAVALATGDSGKVYPFPEITGAAANTEANKEGTTGYGVKRTLAEGRPAYTFDIEPGTNTEKQLRKFNKAIVPVFILDDNGNVWGKLDADGNFVGVKAELFVSGTPFGDGNAINNSKVAVNFQSAADFYDFAAFVNTDFNSSDLEGLLDATLSTLVAPTGNAHKIGAKVVNASLGNDVNMYDYYADELAATSAWTGETAAGATVAPTTVVKDTALKGWTVTFGVAVALINLASPSVLAGLDVTGIEGVELSVA